MNEIQIRGAREHNLKNISIKLPRNQVSVITGLSGSGKSSLAFDTLYAEGQRRYLEGLSSYARQFLDQLKKPEVDAISGLSPAIAIDQSQISHNPRSTVGTTTEVYDYLRLLFARAGQAHCPTHHVPVRQQSLDEIIASLNENHANKTVTLYAPVIRGRKGEFQKEIERWQSLGYLRAIIDGKLTHLPDIKKLARHHRHDVLLLVDQLPLRPEFLSRLRTSVNQAITLGKGFLQVHADDRELSYSTKAGCPECGFSFPELDPMDFSFNSPKGACQRCFGLGSVDSKTGRGFASVLDEDHDIDDSEDDWSQRAKLCPECQGSRLNEKARSVFVGGFSLSDLVNIDLDQLHAVMKQIANHKSHIVVEKITHEIIGRTRFLCEVGLAYLSLHRPSRTLSGGEAQRVRLARQLGAGLVGVLYILDEPSIGLHPRDHDRLLDIIHQIRHRGNTVVMVEHDEDTIRRADYIVDLGPGAGRHGGNVQFEGSLSDLENHTESLTGQYLRGDKKIPLPHRRPMDAKRVITLEGSTGNNLKSVSVGIPLGVFTAVTGVSGSGKSTLILDTLFPALSAKIYKGNTYRPLPYKKLKGYGPVKRIIDINQKPIGRTPRSNPATYVGLFTAIRELFAQIPQAQLQGLRPGHFSFNVKGGRCEHCAGAGVVKVEMHFLTNVYVPCERCLGRRYQSDILSIKYKDRSIADVLDMTVEEAFEFFANHIKISRKLETLKKVGLEYLTLGQSATTLSGGEAQRVKLSRELSKKQQGQSFYILDEPTTGLHFEDIRKLNELLHELVEHGNTVVVIEHNLELIKTADYVIDLGPEGGRHGGCVVAEGTPEEIAEVAESLTGRFLAKKL